MLVGFNMRLTLVLFAFAMVLCSCDASSSKQNPSGLNKHQAAPDVSALYDMKCGICHGRDGKLMVGGASDLTQSSLSLDQRIQLITNGKKTMPPQKNILSEEQIAALAKYVEKFRK